MTCRICGSRCQGTRCRDCERDAEAEARAGDDGTDGGRDPDPLLHECTACGARYETDGSDPCPECGSQRRRYAGEQWSVEQQGLDGGTHEGQATLDGGVVKEVDR